MNNIQGSGSNQDMVGAMGGFRQAAALTNDQKQTVQTILSKYDSKNLTAQNAQDIFKQFMDAGIKPGKDLRDAIKGAGFDPHELRSMAFQSLTANSESSQTTPLTIDQKKQVQAILSNFDPKNLTASDAQSIFKQLQQAGIQPTRDLKDTIKAAGFNPDQLASLAAPVAGQYGAVQPQTQNQNINTSALQTLQSILNQYDLKNLTQDQQKSLMTQLDKAGLLQSGDIINIGA